MADNPGPNVSIGAASGGATASTGEASGIVGPCIMTHRDVQDRDPSLCWACDERKCHIRSRWCSVHRAAWLEIRASHPDIMRCHVTESFLAHWVGIYAKMKEDIKNLRRAHQGHN